MLIAEWQVGEVVWAMFWFTVFFLYADQNERDFEAASAAGRS